MNKNLTIVVFLGSAILAVLGVIHAESQTKETAALRRIIRESARRARNNEVELHQTIELLRDEIAGTQSQQQRQIKSLQHRLDASIELVGIMQEKLHGADSAVAACLEELASQSVWLDDLSLASAEKFAEVRSKYSPYQDGLNALESKLTWRIESNRTRLDGLADRFAAVSEGGILESYSLIIQSLTETGEARAAAQAELADKVQEEVLMLRRFAKVANSRLAEYSHSQAAHTSARVARVEETESDVSEE